MMRVAAPIMPPTTTIAAPTQNSTQFGPTGSAIPPMTKPMMMTVTATQEAGRPSCPSVGPVCASRPRAPISPATVPDAGCSVTESSSPSSTLLLFSGKCETEHQPAPTSSVGERLGLVPHLAYDDMLGRRTGTGSRSPAIMRDKTIREELDASGTDH